MMHKPTNNAPRRYVFALDLKGDPDLIAQYRAHHEPSNVWPEVKQSIRDAGITDMKIYLCGNRLFMIMDVDDGFSFEHKKKSDEANAIVMEWEALMDKFQQSLPWAGEGEKWVIMDEIFTL